MNQLLYCTIVFSHVLHELGVNVHDIRGEILQCGHLYRFGNAPNSLGHGPHDGAYGVAIATYGNGIAQGFLKIVSLVDDAQADG